LDRAETRRVVEAAKPGELPLDEIKRLPDAEQTQVLTEPIKSGELSYAEVRRMIEEDRARDFAAERDALYPDLARRLAKVDGWAKTKKPVYLRFGELSEGKRSWASVEGIWEEGVSVFSGRLTRGGHFIISTTSFEQSMDFMRLCEEEDRDAYLLRGKRAGRGSAGEPLLGSIGSVEPVPEGCLVAVACGSLSLDQWNIRRFDGLLEEVPELARYFDEED